ncbi:MAG: HEAT repeat domain-containing protein [bacterium]
MKTSLPRLFLMLLSLSLNIEAAPESSAGAAGKPAAEHPRPTVSVSSPRPRGLQPELAVAGVLAGFAQETNLEQLRVLETQAASLAWTDAEVTALIILLEGTETGTKQRMLLRLLYKVGDKQTADTCLRKWITPQTDEATVTDFLSTLPGLTPAHFDFVTELYLKHPSTAVRDAVLDLGLSREWRQGRDYSASESLLIRFVTWILRNSTSNEHRVAALRKGYSRPGVNRDGTTIMGQFLATETNASMRAIAYDIIITRNSSDIVTLLNSREAPIVMLAGLAAFNTAIENDAGRSFFRFHDEDGVTPKLRIVLESSSDPGVRKEAQKILDILRRQTIQNTLDQFRKSVSRLSTVAEAVARGVTREELSQLQAMQATLAAHGGVDDAINKLKLTVGPLPEEQELRKELRAIQSRSGEELEKVLHSAKVVERPASERPEHREREVAGRPNTVSELIAALTSENASTRFQAVTGLADKGNAAKEAIPPLLQMLTDDTQKDAAGYVLQALVKVGPDDPRVGHACVGVLQQDEDRNRGEIRQRARDSLRSLSGRAIEDEAPTLVRLLSSKSQRDRREIPEALAVIGAKGADALFAAIAVTTTQSQTKVLFDSLGFFRSPAQASNVVPRLAVLLQEGDPERKIAVMGALRSIGEPAKETLPQLKVLLHDKEHLIRRNAQWVLAAIGEAAVPTLIEAFDAPEPNTRREALYAVETMGPRGEAAIPAIMKTMRERTNSSTRVPAVQALAGIGPAARPVLPQILAMMKDDPMIVPQVLLSLPKWQPDVEVILPTVIEHLNDPSPLAREQALICLGTLTPPPKAAFKDVMALRTDKDERTRVCVVQLLAQLDPDHPELANILTSMLSDTSPTVRQIVCYRLPQLGPRASVAVPALSAMLSDKNEELRRTVITTLGRIGTTASAALPFLDDMVGDTSLPKESRESAARTARIIRNPSRGP